MASNFGIIMTLDKMWKLGLLFRSGEHVLTNALKGTLLETGEVNRLPAWTVNERCFDIRQALEIFWYLNHLGRFWSFNRPPISKAPLVKFVCNRHQLLIPKSIRKCSYLDFMFCFVDVRHTLFDVLQCLYLSVYKFCSSGYFGLDSSGSL